MSNIELKAGFIEYNVNFITYDSNGFITSNCNSIAFINYGSNPAKIESVILQQNQSLTIDGNAGELINKQFLLTFSGSGYNNLVTIKKNYL
jgi:hypothetical protein